jgi:hypothetical protein
MSAIGPKRTLGATTFLSCDPQRQRRLPRKIAEIRLSACVWASLGARDSVHVFWGKQVNAKVIFVRISALLLHSLDKHW